MHGRWANEYIWGKKEQNRTKDKQRRVRMGSTAEEERGKNVGIRFLLFFEC